MNKEIICDINTIHPVHKVWVAENNKIIKQYQLSIDAIPQFILQQKDITKIFIHGNRDFCKKIETEVTNSTINKYDNIKRKFYYI